MVNSQTRVDLIILAPSREEPAYMARTECTILYDGILPREKYFYLNGYRFKLLKSSTILDNKLSNGQYKRGCKTIHYYQYIYDDKRLDIPYIREMFTAQACSIEHFAHCLDGIIGDFIINYNKSNKDNKRKTFEVGETVRLTGGNASSSRGIIVNVHPENENYVGITQYDVEITTDAGHIGIGTFQSCFIEKIK